VTRNRKKEKKKEGKEGKVHNCITLPLRLKTLFAPMGLRESKKRISKAS